MKRLVLVSLAIAITACADVLTAPPKAPAGAKHDYTCLSGYVTGTGLFVCTDSSWT